MGVDLAFLRVVPNLISRRKDGGTESDATTALTIEGPVAIRYPRGKGIGKSGQLFSAYPWEKAKSCGGVFLKPSRGGHHHL